MVTIHSANGLAAMDTGGTSDPYVRVHTGKQKWHTTVKKKTLQPVWEEKCHPLRMTSLSEPLYLDVYDRDTLNGDDWMGRVPLGTVSELVSLHGAGIFQKGGVKLGESLRAMHETGSKSTNPGMALQSTHSCTDSAPVATLPPQQKLDTHTIEAPNKMERQALHDGEKNLTKTSISPDPHATRAPNKTEQQDLHEGGKNLKKTSISPQVVQMQQDSGSTARPALQAFEQHGHADSLVGTTSQKKTRVVRAPSDLQEFASLDQELHRFWVWYFAPPAD